MTDPELKALAETARNRGLRLVRSRVRTPGKRRFGKAGLIDRSGNAVFGMDAKGPMGTPEAVGAYLRTLDAKDWDASLEAANQEPLKASNKEAKVAAVRPVHGRRDGERRLKPKPRPKPSTPKIRGARPGDAVDLAELMGELGYTIEADQLRRNLAQLRKSGDVSLVAVIDQEIVGVCGVGRRLVLSRAAPLGRISSLIVSREAQGRGVGRILVDAAEAWMRAQGCELVELTSNDRRAEAHAFYRHLGYERTGIRFVKHLESRP